MLNKGVRQSNFELMRILSMIFVVMWHLILHGGLYNTTGVTKMGLEFLILLGVVHINSFVLISGYFQYEKKFSLSKFLNILFISWFYKAVISLIFHFSGMVTLSKLDLVKELLPLDFRNYWYINCYLLLYLLTPWINQLILAMNQREHRRLLIVGFILFSIIPIISQFIVANNGYTIVQFIYMYLVGAYLHKYPFDKNIHFVSYSNYKKQLFFLGSFLFWLVFNFLLLQCANIWNESSNSFVREIGSCLLSSNRSFSNPIVIFQSISYFLFFSTLHIRSRFLNRVAKNVLDVYLIHENFFMMGRLWGWLEVGEWVTYSGYKMIVLVILFSCLVFFSCITLGEFRRKLFRFVGNRKFLLRFREKFYYYISNF